MINCSQKLHRSLRHVAIAGRPWKKYHRLVIGGAVGILEGGEQLAKGQSIVQ